MGITDIKWNSIEIWRTTPVFFTVSREKKPYGMACSKLKSPVRIDWEFQWDTTAKLIKYLLINHPA